MNPIKEALVKRKDASSPVDGSPAESRRGYGSQQRKPGSNPAVAVVHNSRTIMRDVFARQGADPQGDSVIRARFCPECQSTRRKQKNRPVVISRNPSTGRWTWTCQHCHVAGTRTATGDAIEAEKRFRGIRGELGGRDFVALAEELAGGAAPAERSGISLSPTLPDPTASTGAIQQFRWQWERRILFLLLPLPPEFVCMLVAACMPQFPNDPLAFAALCVEFGVKRDTARRIAHRWFSRDPKIFEKLSGAQSDRERHRVLLNAARDKVFLPGVRAAAAMLYYCVRGAGSKKKPIVSVSLLAREAKCCAATVHRWFEMLKDARIFTGDVIPLADRASGNGPVVGLQRKLLSPDSPALIGMKRIAADIRKSWEGLVDSLGRRVRWGLKRFTDTIKSLSGCGPPSPAVG